MHSVSRRSFIWQHSVFILHAFGHIYKVDLFFLTERKQRLIEGIDMSIVQVIVVIFLLQAESIEYK